MDKTIKVPHGYGRQPIINFQEISAGRSPAIPDEKAALWLPGIQASEMQKEWHVVLAGTICARDATTGDLVPANGGVAQNVVYSAVDEAYTPDVEDLTILVVAAKSVSNGLAANLPIGWCYYHWYSRGMQVKYGNYDLQPNVALLNDYLVQVPLLWDEQYTNIGNLVTGLCNGCYVKPLGSGTWKKNGAPVRWLTASDSMEQVAGKIIKIETITADTGLAKTRVVKGTGISGDGTSGLEHWLSATREDGATACTKDMYVAVDFM